ncbi:hypothetical protein GCM10020367_26990 [Streptomyces sannanensis]|uniref:IS5/IS1182 family transposase n=1 Tax=Streptomyces sannanensis TaxID=285536 RepID=A0ABP6SB33_9ACTN
MTSLISHALHHLRTFIAPRGRHRARPYDSHQRRQRRRRRRALWLATYGIDTGPRRIHGVEVA